MVGHVLDLDDIAFGPGSLWYSLTFGFEIVIYFSHSWHLNAWPYFVRVASLDSPVLIACVSSIFDLSHPESVMNLLISPPGSSIVCHA